MKQQIEDSLEPITDLLDQRFQHMKLKEHHFKAADVATESEMDGMFEEVKTIDSSLQQDSLQKKDLMKAKDYQSFMESHSHRSSYAVQLCKCALDTCEYCSNHVVRMPLEEFNSLCHLPLPLLDDGRQHYKPFKQVYGQLPNDRDQLSLVSKMMKKKWIKLIASFCLQLEGSELHLPVESASSPGVFMQKPH